MIKKRVVLVLSLFFLLTFVLLIVNISAFDWPMFMNNLNHTGYQNETLNVGSFTKLWNYSAGNGLTTSSPAVSNGLIYFGSGNNFFALNATNGSKIWNFTILGGSSPAVSNGIVYVGSSDTNIYALNATNGSKIWNFTTGDRIDYSSPAVSNGIVYVGDEKGIYALNATNGSKIWNFTTGNLMASSPAVVNGVVFIGSFDNNLYAFNATNGSKIWNFTTGGSVYSSPAVVNGVVFIGSFDNNLYAFNATNGSKIWNFTTGDSVYSSPAVVNGVVFIGSFDNNLYALNATNGSKIWNFTTGNGIDSSPAVSNGIIYIGSAGTGENFYALNATNGSKIWSYSTASSIDTSPAVSNGIVYVGSSDTNLYAFHSPVVWQCNSVQSCNSAIASASPGDTIQMNQSIAYISDGTAINFAGKDNVTFDCNGFSLAGPDDGGTSNYGIYLGSSGGGSNYDTVQNCNISGFYFGIFLNSASNNTIKNITTIRNFEGVYVIVNSNYNNFSNMSLINNSYAGLELNTVSRNTFTNINVSLNRGSYGITFSLSTYNIFSGATVNNNPSSFGIYLGPGSDNNTFIDTTANYNANYGVYIYSDNNTFINSSANYDSTGFFIASFKNSIINSTANSNSQYGIYLTSSSNNTILNSYITNNSISGLYLETSNNNRFYNNLLNNTLNYYNGSSGLTNFFNTTLQSGTNIVEGSNIGGNYWGNWSNPGTGISDNCVDENSNGVCDSNYSLDGLNYDSLPLYLLYIAPVSNPPPGPGGSAPPGSPGGSSGGGTTVTSNVTVTVGRTITTSAIFTNISVGTPVTFYTNTSAVGVSSITFTTNKTITDAGINVSTITRSSQADLRIRDTGTTYQSFSISTTSNLNDSVITSVTITFEVNKSWFTANRLDPASLVIYRNTNTTPNRANWTALPTTVISQDAQYYYFSAISPGFSEYTIFASLVECGEGVVRCLAGDSQVCSSNTWILSQHCQLGCNSGNGQCLTTSHEAVGFFGNLFNSLQSFVNSLPGTLQLTVGSVTYYVLISLVTSGVVIISTVLVRNARARRKVWKKK